MNKQIFLAIALVFAIASASHAVVVGDFETGLDGWWVNTDWDTATISQSSTGATNGSGALQIEDETDWKATARISASAYRSILGSPGASVSLDVTAFAADLPDGWLNVGIVVNGQSNDNNGANNNVGWTDVGAQQPVPVDGQPHSLVFDLPADLIAKIALTDDNIAWFELVVTKNSGAGKFYIDNVRIAPAPEQPEPGAATVIGNWENAADAWVPIDTTINIDGTDVVFTPVMQYSSTGATLDDSSLKVTVPDEIYQNNSWWQPLVRVFAQNEPGMVQAVMDSRSMKVDLTRLASEWTAGADTHNQISLIINAGGDGWSVWAQSPGLGWWDPGMGDTTSTLKWDYSGVIPDLKTDLGVWWFEIWIVAQASSDYSGTRAFYFDNFNLPVQYKASDPVPADGATQVDRNIALGWRAGSGAASHDVYISTDMAAVGAVEHDNLAGYPQVVYQNTTETTFAPGALDLSTTYYWRIDEVEDANDPAIVAGDIWRFTTADYIVIEDFESYADAPALNAAWPDANDLSTDIVNGGSQAMKAVFDNTGSPFYAEISYTLPAELADLTQQGIKGLNVYFHGDPNNPAEPFSALLEDAHGVSEIVYYDGDPGDLRKEEWQLWEIGLSWFDVDLTDVVRVAFGFGDPLNPTAGGYGTVYFDDIRLYQGQCLLYKRTQDFAMIDYAPLGVNPGDCMVGYPELLIMAADWLKTDAILPAGVDDPNEAGGLLARYALDEGEGTTAVDAKGDETHTGTLYDGVTYITPGYDGTGSAINVTGNTRLEIGTWDPSEGTGELSLSAWIRWSGDQTIGIQGIIGKRDSWAASGAMRWFFETHAEGDLAFRQYWEAGTDIWTAPGILNPFIGKWAHVAVTFADPNAVIYLNGEPVAEGPFVLADKPDAGIGIGNTHGSGGGETFQGDIDEVQIYNRALSALEVAYLADLTKGDGELQVPIASVADIAGDEPAGQKSINFKDFAVLASYWLNDQIWPF